MHNIRFFKQITNLDKENITFMSVEEVVGSIGGSERTRIILTVRGKYTTGVCPHCSQKTSKRKDRKLHESSHTLKHMPYGGDKIIELNLLKRCFRCTACNKSFFERFAFESPFGNYTTHFEKYVQWNWGFVSGNKITELYQSSNSVIYSILERIDINLLNERGLKIIEELDEIYLGVDEHSFSGHDMVLVITELKTKQVLAILDGITKEKLEEWIWKIPLKYHKKIKGFATDMNKGYAVSLNQIIGNPIQSVDKFHLFEEANKVVDEVRQTSIWGLAMNFVRVEDIPKLGKKIGKKLTKEDIANIHKNSKIEGMQKYKEAGEMRLKAEQIDKSALFNSKGEKVEYKEITADYFIETGYRKIFFYREKNLSPISKLRLNQIFREFDYLGLMQQAWTLKEDFFDAMDNLDMKEIDRIQKECLESTHYRIQQFGRTLKRWHNGIKGFCEHSTAFFKFTNALTEGINNVCKVAKRVSHGFKTKEMYLKKLVAKFCITKLEF